MRIFQFIHFCFLANSVLCQSVNDAKKLLRDLFITNGYNKLVRPSVDQSQPASVNVEMWLYAIHNLDEVQQKLTTSGHLFIEWTDELLTWTPSDYDGIERIYIPQGNIWKPDLSLQNGFQDLKELGSNFIQVIIESNGHVQWFPFEQFETECTVDTTYFPFDQQTCHIMFIVWTSDKDDIILNDIGQGITMYDRLKRNSEWKIPSSSSKNFIEDAETRVEFSLTIQRRPLFVVVTIILPTVLLSFLGIFSFVIPIDCGERMGYTISVWLAFAVFLTIVSSSLPRNSDSIPIIAVYIMIQLIIGTIIAIVSSIFARLASRSEKVVVSPRIMCILKCRLQNLRITPDHDEYEPEQDTGKVKSISWKEIVSVLDFYMFLIFFISLLLTTVTMFLYICLS